MVASNPDDKSGRSPSFFKRGKDKKVVQDRTHNSHVHQLSRKEAKLKQKELLSRDDVTVRQAVKTLTPLQRILAQMERDHEVKRYNKGICLVGGIGVLLMVIEMQYSWDTEVKEMVPDQFSQILKLVISITTVALVFGVYKYYQIQLEIIRKLTGNPLLRLRQTALFAPFMAEAFICAIHVPPYAAETTQLYQRFGLVMFLRVYLLVRVVRDHTSIYIHRYEIMQHGKYHDMSEFNWMLCMKTLFYQHQGLFVAILAFLSLSILSFSLYVNERDKDHKANPEATEFNFQNTVYMTLVTMTTVGYGDMAPVSFSGRIAALLAAIVGIIISSLLIAVVTTKLQLNSQQQFAIMWHRKNKKEEEEKRYAVMMIQNIWRLKLKIRSKPKAEDQKPEWLHQATHLCNRVKKIRIHFNKVHTDVQQMESQLKDPLMHNVELLRDENHKMVTKLSEQLNGVIEHVTQQDKLINQMEARFAEIEQSQALVCHQVSALLAVLEFDPEPEGAPTMHK